MAVAIAWGLCIVWSCDCGATFSVTTRRRHDVTSLSRSVDKVTFLYVSAAAAAAVDIHDILQVHRPPC